MQCNLLNVKTAGGRLPLTKSLIFEHLFSNRFACALILTVSIETEE